MSDIIDAIDALVDEQLAAGPRDDYNANRYDKCPHCGRQWHGLAITERIADMYTIGVYDETYSAATDTSRVLCRGSDFIGPMPDERRYETAVWTAFPPVRSVRWFPSYREHFAPPDDRRWWRLPCIPDGASVRSFETLGRYAQEVTLTTGERQQTWNCAYLVTTELDDGTISIGGIDVLASLPPDIGGTWEPLTAPGSIDHPDYLGPYRVLAAMEESMRTMHGRHFTEESE